MKLCFPMLCISMMFWVLLCPMADAQYRLYSRRTKVMRGFDSQPGTVDQNRSYMPQIRALVYLNDKDSEPGSVGSMTSSIPPTQEVRSPSAEDSAPGSVGFMTSATPLKQEQHSLSVEESGPRPLVQKPSNIPQNHPAPYQSPTTAYQSKVYYIKPITEPRDYPTYYLGPNSAYGPKAFDIKPITEPQDYPTHYLGPNSETSPGTLDIKPNTNQETPVTYYLSSLRGRRPSVGFDTPQHYINITTDVELNSPCRTSYDCRSRILNSQCNIERHVCECLPYHIPYNSTMCLPASLLGFPCITDEQCNVKVKHGLCIDGTCGCEPRYFPLRFDKCCPPAKIGQLCVSDQQCRHHDIYSYCNFHLATVYGYCQCPPGYIVNEFGLNCLPRLGYHCANHEDCEAVTPGSYCKIDENVQYAHCACLPGMEPTVDNLHCIFDRSAMFANTTKFEDLAVISLGKECQVHAECQKRDPHSHCLNGICECVEPDSECSANNTGCHPGTFQCRNGYCISWYFVCDGTKNCADGSDEDCERYRCPEQAFQCNDGTCLPRHVLCNDKWECPDGSDEARCYKGIACDKDAFRCRNGQCKPSYSFCNAIQDCTDGSDEITDVCEYGLNCTTIFKHHLQCDNRRCRGSTIACSGADGCGDNSDENKCEVCYCKRPLK